MKFDDARRLIALADYRVLDTPAEAVFDNITRLAATIFHTPIALVSLVDEHRQWFKSKYGLEASETPREHAFCDHAIRTEEPFIVEDATKDPRFMENPLVTGEPGVRFYCGVPLRTPDGHALGTLCLIDRVPRSIAPAQLTALKSLARRVELELEIRRRLLMLEDSLKVQRNVQHQREVLASMLVHDLRNPLTAVSLLVASIAPDDESRVVVEDIQCEIDRMRRMLTDVLDVCLASMGELRLRRVEFPIQRLAREVARRMTPIACSRGQSIALELPHEPIMVHADPQLIERVLENLLGNAMHHGPRAQTITLAIHAIQGERVRAEVRDAGDALPASKRGLVFEPFESLDAAQAGGGHGLGLAFCRLAIEAHAGNIDVQPNADKGNCFFFEIPIHQR